jgi:hypothetical protein
LKWLILMIAMMCLPFGLPVLALGIVAKMKARLYEAGGRQGWSTMLFNCREQRAI